MFDISRERERKNYRLEIPRHVTN